VAQPGIAAGHRAPDETPTPSSPQDRPATSGTRPPADTQLRRRHTGRHRSDKTLEKLDLQEARLTLAGLKQLQSLPQLQELKVQWVDTPPADIEQLRQLLPNVKITWQPITDEERESLLTKKLKL
jgi:hypothetical protein